MQKIIPHGDAIDLIRDGDTIAPVGYGGNGTPEHLFAAIEERFLETGHPRDLTLVYAGGQGDGKHPGLESLEIAMASKNSGGIVICQVERVAQTGTLDARRVRPPGTFVVRVV